MRTHRGTLAGAALAALLLFAVAGTVHARRPSPDTAAIEEDAAAQEAGGEGAPADRDPKRYRVQRCLAEFDGKKVELRIRYRGNLVTGQRLTIYAVEAAPADEGVAGLIDNKLFTPADQYSPRGFFGRLRTRLRVPFLRRLSDRYAGQVCELQSFVSGDTDTLERTDEETPRRIQVQGLDDYTYLASAFAHQREDGSIAGAIVRDTDNDGIVNLFDDQPFYFEERSDSKDMVKDRLTDQAQGRLRDVASEVGDVSRDPMRRLDLDARKRLTLRDPSLRLQPETTRDLSLQLRTPTPTLDTASRLQVDLSASKDAVTQVGTRTVSRSVLQTLFVNPVIGIAVTALAVKTVDETILSKSTTKIGILAGP